MRILIDLGHPAHVHFFRQAVAALRADGHEVRLAARDIPIVFDLLTACGLAADIVVPKGRGALGLVTELVRHTTALLAMTRAWRPDVCTAIGGTFMVAAARLRGARTIVWDDTDTAVVENQLTHRLAHRIMTPDVYPADIGPKQMRYHGLHELAYLHPARFRPKPKTLEHYGLSPEAPYAMVRLCAFEAGHDLAVRRAVDVLAGRGEVLLVPEGSVPEALAGRVRPVRPEDFHDLLAFAAFCLTEGATTASEACILGTPALYINPIVTCYIRDLERRGLLAIARPGEDLAGACAALAGRPVEEARQTAGRVFSDYEDVTALVVNTLLGREGPGRPA
jgi:predicted glycosyltransferase